MQEHDRFKSWQRTTANSKVTPADAKSATLGGAAVRKISVDGPSLADILPYAPRVDRADMIFDQNDWCPQLRINYSDE